MFKGVWSAMATGFAIETGYEGLDSLFSRGGMSSMLETVWLIISAMAFGGVMRTQGCSPGWSSPSWTGPKAIDVFWSPQD
jgi:Na+/H+ antiporter NhaC